MERVLVENISKTYKVGLKRHKTALARMVSGFSGKDPKGSLAALRDISFSAEVGEVIGIIGRNGCGKTTLLRIIAGIIDKDSGVVRTNGKLVSFLSLDAGMKGRLTMQENVVLFCTLLGMNVEEIRRRFDAIVSFAELEKFVYTEWHSFSDGMKQRAILATALHTEPDILLLDESFSAGDRQFRKKSVEKIQKLAESGATIILASHELPIIEAMCHRALWIEGGGVRSIGQSMDVVREYRGYEGKQLS